MSASLGKVWEAAYGIRELAELKSLVINAVSKTGEEILQYILKSKSNGHTGPSSEAPFGITSIAGSAVGRITRSCNIKVHVQALAAINVGRVTISVLIVVSGAAAGEISSLR